MVGMEGGGRVGREGMKKRRGNGTPDGDWSAVGPFLSQARKLNSPLAIVQRGKGG